MTNANIQVTIKPCPCGGEWLRESICGITLYSEVTRDGKNVLVYRVKCSGCGRTAEVER